MFNFLAKLPSPKMARPPTPLGSRRLRMLLAYLLLLPEEDAASESGAKGKSERTVSFKTLLEKVWPGNLEASNLRHRILDLRALFGEGVLLQPSRSQLCLDRTRLTVDVLEFDALLSRNPPDYEQAIPLYRGDLLPGDNLDWLVEARQYHKKRYQEALESLVLRAEADRNLEAQEKYLLRLAATNPANSLWQLALMKLYVAQRNGPAAQKVYRRYISALPKDATPDSEIKGLEASLRRVRNYRKRPQLDESVVWCGFPVHLAPIFGREEELKTISSASVLARLITLTGPPGIGKTFLALHAAANMHQNHPDGGAFVDLAAATTNDHCLRKVASACSASLSPDSREERLKGLIVDSLKSKRFLLVLDNCEHLLEPVSNLLKDLLRECERVRVLVTSQVALRTIRGEREIALSPLSVSDDPVSRSLSPTAIQQLSESPAVALFLREASAVPPGFALTENNAGAVVRLCQLLEGLPLAIKIAAGLLDDKPLEVLIRLLRSQRRILDAQETEASGRPRTLRATLDTSFGLLPPKIATHFVFLAVFQGGWTLEAAGEVLGDGAEDSLAQLQARSLITRRAENGSLSSPRFGFLELIHRFCADRLARHAEATAIRTRHLQCYAHLAERLEGELSGPDQERALDQLEEDRHNIDSALGWAISGGNSEYGLRLAGAVWRFWYTRGVAQEGVERLETLLASYGVVDKKYVKGLRAAGNLWFQRNDYLRAQRLYGDLRAASETLEDRRGVASALGSLGNIASRLGQLGEAQNHYSRSLTIFRTLDDIPSVARVLDNMATIACLQADYGNARTLNQESVTLFRQLGDAHNEAMALNNLVQTETEAQNYFQAIQVLRESMTACIANADRYSLVQCLFLHFCLATKLGLYERAALLLGASDAHRESLGLPLHTAAVTEYHANADTLRRHLGDREFEASVTKGRAMEVKSLLAYAWEAFDHVLAENAFVPHLEL